jgi:hypothetical protein
VATVGNDKFLDKPMRTKAVSRPKIGTQLIDSKTISALNLSSTLGTFYAAVFRVSDLG